MRGLWIPLLAFAITAQAMVDLEWLMPSDFVVETKQIDIPGFPEAYNPSLVTWGNGYVLSFRTGIQPKCGDADVKQPFMLTCRHRHPLKKCEEEALAYEKRLTCKNQIGLILLDQNFEPKSVPHILYIDYPPPFIAERQHDPRLVFVNHRLFMVFSNMINGRGLPEIRRPVVVELAEKEGVHFAMSVVAITRYEGEDPAKWAKNWVPFDYEGELLFSHHISPHIVFRYDATPHCQTMATTNPKLPWNFGELRGGTPAILDESGQYLSFFHSAIAIATTHSRGETVPHYFMGAYTFSAKPPFAITRMSQKPIVGENFYHGKEHKTWKPLRVVFPGGIVVRADKVWVAYGRQDHEVWVATLDKKKLMASMTIL